MKEKKRSIKESLNSKDFLNIWKLFIEENHLKGSVSSEVLENYKSSKKWTRYIVGSPKREENDSNLGKLGKLLSSLSSQSKCFKLVNLSKLGNSLI